VVSNDRSELRWGVEQRLEFIEFRLFWEGHVNRSDVMTQFGLSVNQASSDLSRYIGLAPHNMDYDRSLRTYVRQPAFKPVFDKLDAGRYLAQLRSVADGILDQDDCWIAGLPAYDSAPTPARGVDPATLRSVVDAIRQSEAIEVQYQSLSNPEPRWRWIAPHAIAFDGFRWHARAFCFSDEVFKDFLLSRILDIRGSRASDVLAENDQDWHTFATLEIGPHPALSAPMKPRSTFLSPITSGPRIFRTWPTRMQQPPPPKAFVFFSVLPVETSTQGSIQPIRCGTWLQPFVPDGATSTAFGYS